MYAFVSHAVADKHFIDTVRGLLRRNGITPLIAEDDVSMSETVSEKVERYIRQSQLALVLLTKNGNASRFVQQEIGYLESQKKPMLVLVEKGLEKDVTGFLYGRDFVTVDPEDIESGLIKAEEKIAGFVRRWWKGMIVLAVIVIVVILWAFSRN